MFGLCGGGWDVGLGRFADEVDEVGFGFSEWVLTFYDSVYVYFWNFTIQRVYG